MIYTKWNHDNSVIIQQTEALYRQKSTRDAQECVDRAEYRQEKYQRKLTPQKALSKKENTEFQCAEFPTKNLRL